MLPSSCGTMARGMTEAEIEIALERFGQVDGGLLRRHEGSGLGLPLARKLAELHGGSLSLESEKGRGTTATVILPSERIVGASAGRPSDRSRWQRRRQILPAQIRSWPNPIPLLHCARVLAAALALSVVAQRLQINAR